MGNFIVIAVGRIEEQGMEERLEKQGQRLRVSQGMNGNAVSELLCSGGSCAREKMVVEGGQVSGILASSSLEMPRGHHWWLRTHLLGFSSDAFEPSGFDPFRNISSVTVL